LVLDIDTFFMRDGCSNLAWMFQYIFRILFYNSESMFVRELI